jgi:antibiotic biosynthesis monooxygenase (ABM) superfamily enzyme
MEPTLLHVFAFTPLEGATEQDFADFQAATAEMVGQIPGLRRAWFGRLLQPIPNGGGHVREYGVAMEFDNIEALRGYADHPAHRAWEQVYARVRVPGTTTLDIPGE